MAMNARREGSTVGLSMRKSSFTLRNSSAADLSTYSSDGMSVDLAARMENSLADDWKLSESCTRAAAIAKMERPFAIRATVRGSKYRRAGYFNLVSVIVRTKDMSVLAKRKKSIERVEGKRKRRNESSSPSCKENEIIKLEEKMDRDLVFHHDAGP